jgi:RNA polymerase sigma-70 factor (ECF subfamily)
MALPADYRTAVVLHDVEGLSNLEAVEPLNLSVANMKTHVHRARLFLRKRLAALHGDEQARRVRRQSRVTR